MLKILLTLLISFLTVRYSPTTYTKVVTLNSEIIGPFNVFDSDRNISVTAKYTHSTDSMREEIRAYQIGSTSLLYKSTTANHSMTSQTARTFTFPLKLKKYFSTKGLKLEFRIYDGSSQVYWNTVSFYPIDGYDVDVNSSKEKHIQGKPTAFKFVNGNIDAYYDDYNFVNFKDYIDAENYYSLELKENRFLYTGNLEYSSAKVSIADEKRILKNFLHDNEGNINLKLDVVDYGTYKGFKYKNKFYVDRLNLDCADYQLPNYVQTNSLYLPVNKKDDFLGTEIIIKLTGAGFSKFNFTFHMFYDVDWDLLGSCNNSDYCIKGEAE